MKLRNISIISAGIIMLLLPVKASAFIIPKDLPTIEALIALHKAIKKDEDKALTRVATSYGEQSLIEKGAEKFNDVRTTLDTRLNNAYSYLVLAGAISSTANSLYQLVTEYKDFTGNTFSYVSKKPFVAWYYADANVAISREIQHCYRLYASVAASGINLMKASMDEKLNLVMTLKASIDRARYIIDNANLYCFLVTDCGWKPSVSLPDSVSHPWKPSSGLYPKRPRMHTVCNSVVSPLILPRWHRHNTRPRKASLIHD